MKKLRLFYASWCPHCKNAKTWMAELKKEDPRYESIDIEEIDYEKNPEKMKGLQFELVPTYYLGDKKIFEGAPKKEIIKEIFDKTLES